jgi:hypothetical protein
VQLIMDRVSAKQIHKYMALGKNERTGSTFVNIYQKNKKDAEGKIVYTDDVAVWIDDENGTDIRYSENKQTGVISPKKGWWYDYIEGIVTGVKVDEKNKYGARLEINIVDGEDSYLLCAGLDGAYGRSLAERIPNVTLGDKVKFQPYAFTDDTGKDRKGTSVKINNAEENAKSYFFDGEKTLHGAPEFPANFKDLPTARKQQFGNEQVIFLSEFINNHFADVTAPSAPAEEMDLDNI